MNLYETNFALMQHHKYSLTELENMIPWERDVYVNLLIRYLREEERNRNENEIEIKNMQNAQKKK